ncbi:MAG: hypothetical protein ACE5JR_03095 [Gemmatimonadota bacterium]
MEGAEHPAIEDELKDFVKGRLAAYKHPRRITSVDGLSKTATGKIRRFLLRAGGRDASRDVRA